MLQLLMGLTLFLGVHSVSIINESWRNKMVAGMGVIGWKLMYSLVALAGLVLIIRGYGEVRYDSMVLYTSPVWLKHLSLVALYPVFPLLIAAYFPGRIKNLVHHPMLLAVKTWAFSHLLVNGTVASSLLFGSFLLWAVVDRISLNRRQPRDIPGAPLSNANDFIAVGVGTLLYGAFIFKLHSLLVGVSVI